MNNLALGLQLMLIGMVTVFCILLIVIFGSRLLITIINKIAPEEHKPTAPHPKEDEALMPVLSAAVAQITGGRGHITKVTIIN